MDMHFRLLTVISDRNESLAAFHVLKESLRKEAQVFADHLIGWQGGNRRHTVYWQAKLGVWAVLEPAPPSIKEGVRHRFWNCFGIENPVERQMLKITVEINPPHEGENRRVAGMFTRDNEDRIYLAHTGRQIRTRQPCDGLRACSMSVAGWLPIKSLGFEDRGRPIPKANGHPNLQRVARWGASYLRRRLGAVLDIYRAVKKSIGAFVVPVRPRRGLEASETETIHLRHMGGIVEHDLLATDRICQ
jgi:hypothetical protein